MKIELFNWRFRFQISLKKLVEVTGINSNIDETMHEHILLWDFDNQTLEIVTASLSKTQDYWNLPRIYIIESNKNRYHAYCFYRAEKWLANAILSSTPCICETFFKLGVMRGYWTLRITPKRKNEGFRLVRELPSPNHEDLGLVSLMNTVKYKTELH